MAELPSTQPAFFFFVPDPVLDYDDLTVAVYGGVARCCVAQRGAVPLSAPDLAAWFSLRGEPGRVAIMRRIQRLITDGWLDSQGQPGKKQTLQPTWGRSREGELRLWDWAQPDRGRPDWQRGRRVPLALFDDYLGQLVPNPDASADHRSWWSLPILTGKDAGSWMIGLLVETVRWTPRLIHLGLNRDSLLSRDELRERAQSGQLTTLDEDGEILPVRLSHDAETPRTRSKSSARTRSSPQIGLATDSESPTAAECGKNAESRSSPQIAWDLRNKLTNNSNPPKESDHHRIGKGDDRLGLEIPTNPTNPTNATSSTPTASQSPAACDENHTLDPQVIAGHEALNPGIVIPPGEWLELARIQQQHGAAAMLIWQARATRRTHAASGRVVPAYYAACAAREAVDAYQPPRHSDPPPAAHRDTEPANPAPTPEPRRSPRTSAAPAKPPIAPEADAMLRAMGIRLRSALASVPLDLIQQWQQLVDHPALVARFPRDHRGWIWTQLRDLMLPPSAEELASWLQATGKQEPPDWGAIAEASDGLMRLGDDLSDMDGADDPPPDLPPPEPSSASPAAAALPSARADDLADQIRAEVRLRSGDRALRQILDRARIEQRGDGLLVRCGSADLRLLLAHTAVLRAAAIGVGQQGNVQCVAF